MYQGRLFLLSYCNSIYLIWLFIQLIIFLGNLFLCSKGILLQIVKCWLLLRTSAIGIGTLWVVLFVFKLTINHLVLL